MLAGDMPTNPPFELDNRSKRSIVLDLTTEADKETALELIATADVFLSNPAFRGAPRQIGARLRKPQGHQPEAGVLRHRGLRHRRP